jgi:CBS domain containing-hemolysin-like protein
LFWRIIPKSIAIRKSESTTMAIAIPLEILYDFQTIYLVDELYV